MAGFRNDVTQNGFEIVNLLVGLTQITTQNFFITVFFSQLLLAFDLYID